MNLCRGRPARANAGSTTNSGTTAAPSAAAGFTRRWQPVDSKPGSLVLNRIVTNVYDRALRTLGLKASQLNILVAAGKLGVAHPKEVCSILQLDASTLSRNVKRMRAKGWLEGVASPDARSQPFRLAVLAAPLEGGIVAPADAQRRPPLRKDARGAESQRQQAGMAAIHRHGDTLPQWVLTASPD